MMPSGVEQFCCLLSLSVCAGLRKSAESLSERDFLTNVSRSACVGEGFPLSVGPSSSQPPDGKICLLFRCHFMSPLHRKCKPSLPDKYVRRHMCNHRPNIALNALAVLVIWIFFFCRWFLVLDKDYRLSRLRRHLELSYLLCDLSL